MALYISKEGVVTELSEVHTSVDGVMREISDMQTSQDGVVKTIYSSGLSVAPKSIWFATWLEQGIYYGTVGFNKGSGSPDYDESTNIITCTNYYNSRYGLKYTSLIGFYCAKYVGEYSTICFEGEFKGKLAVRDVNGRKDFMSATEYNTNKMEFSLSMVDSNKWFALTNVYGEQPTLRFDKVKFKK